MTGTMLGLRAAAVVGLAGTVAGSACNARLRIGVVLPESGSAAVYGAPIKTGVKLALDQAVADGVAPAGLEVLYRDSGSEPSRAALAATALFEDGARIVIGGVTTAEAKAILPVAERWERVLLSPSASAPELGRRSSFFFRVYPSDDLEGAKAADLFAIDRGIKSVFILEEDNDYTRGLLPVFVQELQAQGGRIVGSLRVSAAGWERALREALQRLRPDGIYVCAYGEPTLGAIRAIRNVGFAGTVCVTSAIAPATFLQRAGAVAEGVYFPLAGGADPGREVARTFRRRYVDRYRMTPDTYAIHGYDAALAAVLALGQAACRAGGDLRTCLRSLGDREGVTGRFVFDDYGNIRRSPTIHCIHRGAIDECDPQRVTGNGAKGRSAAA